MAVYGILLEDYIIEAKSNKNDLMNTKKNKQRINKGKTPVERIINGLEVIALIILAIPAGLLLALLMPIIGTVKDNLNKVEFGLKKNETERIAKSYKKNISSLQKRLEKENDPKKKKDIKDSIKALEDTIADIEKNNMDKVSKNKYKYEIDCIEDVVKQADKNIIDFYDRYWMYSLFLKFFDLSRSDFEKHINSNINAYDPKLVKELDGEGFDLETMPEFKVYLNKYPDDMIVRLNVNGDSGICYNLTKHHFVNCIEDWSEFSTPSYEEFKNSITKFKNWNNYVEADKILGYYRLSKPPRNATLKEISKFK